MLLTQAGCARQQTFLEDQSWTRDQGGQGERWREVESLFSAEESDADNYNAVLLGVRHDLAMMPEAKPTAVCNCLDVLVGRPEDPGFAWAGERPIVSVKHQVVAVRPRGRQCQGGQAIIRPSIRAVDSEGGNVFLVIEELRLDRPSALGAVVPQMQPGGTLFVRSNRESEPFGGTARLADGTVRTGGWKERLCRVTTRPIERAERHR